MGVQWRNLADSSSVTESLTAVSYRRPNYSAQGHSTHRGGTVASSPQEKCPHDHGGARDPQISQMQADFLAAQGCEAPSPICVNLWMILPKSKEPSLAECT
jgi:hypothetical protein